MKNAPSERCSPKPRVVQLDIERLWRRWLIEDVAPYLVPQSRETLMKKVTYLSSYSKTQTCSVRFKLTRLRGFALDFGNL